MHTQNGGETHGERAYAARLEARISELEARVDTLKTFIDSSEVAIYITDYTTGEVLFANRKMAALGGHRDDPETLVGQICWDIIREGGEGRCSFCPYKHLLGEDGTPLKPYVWERFFPSLGLWLRIINQAIYWPDGRLAQSNTFYDITEMKNLQRDLAAHARQSEHQRMQQTLQEILDTLPLPVRIMEQDTGVIVYVNKACARLFAFAEQSDMIGLNAVDFLPPAQSDGTDVLRKFDAWKQRGESFQTEIEYLGATGTLIDAHVHVCLIEYGGKQCTLGIIMDMAAQREQQRLLQMAAEREREANKLKSSFLSNMSHEIRTPMNAIIGLTEIELHKRGTRETEVYRKINISAKNLLEIINDILDLSKIEADKLELFPDRFALEEVLNNALLVASPQLEGKCVEFMLDVSPDLPRYVVGDKTRLWQVLKNYLDNAAKFTQEGYILLSVSEDASLTGDDAIGISFVVSDTGVGMDAAQLQKAFLPYEQIYNNTQKRYTGTGLGLPLSKRICELMGGRLTFDSSPGMGTTVCFSLPFGRCQTDAAQEQAACLSGLRFLAVDDSDVTLRVLGKLLQKGGASYMVAHGGPEALKLMGSGSHFDVILLDYILEGENGFEIARQMRRLIPESVKILLVTAFGSHLERSDLEADGISGVIEKPFVPSLFYEKILSVVRQPGRDGTQPDTAFGRFTGARVLVCEDNSINQMVAAGMLEQFGISPVFADDGKAGLDILARGEPFDLILMDVHMPVMDGYETTRAIRADDRLRGVPIISLTADAMTESIEQCLACGMNGFLSKPFVMEDFYEMLLKWLPESKREANPL